MSIHTLSEIYHWLLYTCAAGQILFVILWSTVKWWETRIGRALFVKSLSVALALFTVSFFSLTRIHFTARTFYEVYIAAFAFMFIGISYQDFAMFSELKASKLERSKEDEERTGVGSERSFSDPASSYRGRRIRRRSRR